MKEATLSRLELLRQKLRARPGVTPKAKVITKELIAWSGHKLVRTQAPIHTVQTGIHEDAPSSRDVAFRNSAWRYSVPTSHMVGRPCFSYAPEGWHPFVATIREMMEHGVTGYEGSVLEAFYDQFQPETIADASTPVGESAAIEELSQFKAQSLFEPWFMREPPFNRPQDPSCQPPGSPMFGPRSPTEGRRSYARLADSLKSIEQYGYQPARFERGRIGVSLLLDPPHVRYLVIHGQHRLAVLVAKGVESVEVCIYPGMPPVIHVDDVEQWPYVANGLISADAALAMFRRYFENDGWQVGHRLSSNQPS